MSDSKSVKMHYDVAGDDFDRAGEALSLIHISEPTRH